MTLPAKLPLGFALLLCAPLAAAQSNLGELLDAGAKKLSVEEFKQEVVQRVIVGPTPSGGTMEVMYVSNGSIQGQVRGIWGVAAMASINGEWTTDDNGRICTGFSVAGGSVSGMRLPSRCQFWFKYAEQYFFSDSDSDRHARVLSRTVKQ
jgi:hypothetical protein